MSTHMTPGWRLALAREQAEGLRSVARMIEHDPDQAVVLNLPLRAMCAYVVSANADARAILTSFRRAATAAGAEVRVENEPDFCRVVARFGPVEVSVQADAALMADLPAPPVVYIPLDDEEA
ncbi:hypothetical protein ATK36_0474 [Amycolatopsis sulphurea]|uniref:Uncharacterized protein n=1 Tax=Amycolatopsis sulphurea TaxID=76022 RepID=A0A2A9G0J5_9PSEU|nr:hypothetical protein [Amycolatopsis sulphurea]PFG56938.1 hypothetical protein ATK36_0474 [Amycolatopsis sulphurea]